MQGLIGPLKELAEFEELCKNKKKDAGMIRVCGCVNSQKSHMMYAIGDGCNTRSSPVPVRQKQNRYMKNTDSWTTILICIRQRIFCSIKQISVVKSW